MFQKINFIEKKKLSTFNTTKIKFGENFEFNVTRKFGACFVENIKGDFDITNITTVSIFSGFDTKVNFNKSTNSFYSTVLNEVYTFYITANVEMEEIAPFTPQIHIPLYRLKSGNLEVNQYFRDEFVLPKYPDFKFIYYVKKIGSEGKNIEIHIENPYSVKIQGKNGDYTSMHNGDKDIILQLSFVFDPSEERLSDCETEDAQTELAHDTVAEKSRPQSVIPTLPDNQFNETWYKIMSNEKYADVFLISIDGTKIPSHRCVLAEFSPIFAKIIDQTFEIPIIINVEDFDVETVKAVLAFLIGKRDSIVGKEENVFKFAVKYRIQTIMEACRTYFEKSVNPSNVCEYIQIAYSNDFEELKQKCLEILVEKKNEIDASKFADLPKNILCNFYKF